jgi:HK97 family phage portal protein
MGSFWDAVQARVWGRAEKAITTEDLRRQGLLREVSTTGDTVSPESAMLVPTVLACARVIAEGVAQAAMRFYRPEAEGRARVLADNHPVARLLGRKPNFWQTSFEFRETMILHAALTGNAYALKSRAADGRLIELLPFPFGSVTANREPDMTVTYRVVWPGGTKTAKLTANEVWHFRGPSWNTWSGMEPTRLAREAIALAAATERRHALLHSSRPDPGGIYSVEDKLSKEQFEFLRKWIIDTTTGASAGGPMILDRGAKWASQAMTGVDAQHLETRKYQVEEICRAFRVNPLMVGHSDKTATYASAEQMFIAHVVHTLTPWCTRFEQAAEADLFDAEDPIDVWFDLRSLMRGTAVDRATYLAKALGSGGAPAWITPNEARQIDGLDPLDDPDADVLPKPQVKPAPQDAAPVADQAAN